MLTFGLNSWGSSTTLQTVKKITFLNLALRQYNFWYILFSISNAFCSPPAAPSSPWKTQNNAVPPIDNRTSLIQRSFSRTTAEDSEGFLLTYGNYVKVTCEVVYSFCLPTWLRLQRITEEVALRVPLYFEPFYTLWFGQETIGSITEIVLTTKEHQRQFWKY